MYKLYPVRQKRDAAVRIAPLRPVFKVAAYRAAHRRELAAYLVMTPREQFYFPKELILCGAEQAVFKHRHLGVRHLVVIGKTLVVFFIAQQPGEYDAFLFRRSVFCQRPIGLVDLPVAEHVAQPCQRFRRLGKYDKSRDGSVETVDHSEEYISGLVMPFLYIFLHHIDQGLIARFVALHNLSALLQDYDNMVVFVNDRLCDADKK